MKSKIATKIVNASYYPRLFIDWIVFLWMKRSNNLSLLDKFRGEDCLVVGNGPSLNQTPLSKVKMPSIGMNKINLLFDKTEWRPDLIVCSNGLVLKQNREFFNSTSIPLILPIKALYLGIKKRANIIFVGYSNSLFFIDDLNQPLGIGSTVTFAAMQVAAHAKVKSVNLVGVDHNFVYKDANTTAHNIEIQKGDDPNHFDSNYFKDTLWGLPDLDGSEKAYLLAKEYFEAKDIKIIDYTINGKLKVFPKKSINVLVDNCITK